MRRVVVDFGEARQVGVVVVAWRGRRDVVVGGWQVTVDNDTDVSCRVVGGRESGVQDLVVDFPETADGDAFVANLEEKKKLRKLIELHTQRLEFAGSFTKTDMVSTFKTITFPVQTKIRASLLRLLLLLSQVENLSNAR